MLGSCMRSILVGLLVLFSCVCADATQVPGMIRIPGHVLPALSKATIVPSKSEAGTQPVTLTLILKRDTNPDSNISCAVCTTQSHRTFITS